MKKVLLVVALITALAMLVVPVIAAPLHKVTYDGKGISVDNPNKGYDIIGDKVQFSGMAKQADGATPPVDGIWKGDGSFVDKDKGIKAQLVVDHGIYCYGDFILFGDADVTINKVKKGTHSFELRLSPTEVPPSYELTLRMDPVDSTTWFSWRVFDGSKGNKIDFKSF
jgi:hypothetical protein